MYIGRHGATCGLNSAKLLGRVTVPLADLTATETRPVVYHLAIASTTLSSSSFIKSSLCFLCSSSPMATIQSVKARQIFTMSVS
ncbi:hypothetical protein OROMI_003702 [Orobanche minor]